MTIWTTAGSCDVTRKPSRYGRFANVALLALVAAIPSAFIMWLYDGPAIYAGALPCVACQCRRGCSAGMGSTGRASDRVLQPLGRRRGLCVYRIRCRHAQQVGGDIAAGWIFMSGPLLFPRIDFRVQRYD